MKDSLLDFSKEIFYCQRKNAAFEQMIDAEAITSYKQILLYCLQWTQSIFLSKHFQLVDIIGFKVSTFYKKYFLCKILNDLCRFESLLRGHSNFQIPSLLNNLRLVQKKLLVGWGMFNLICLTSCWHNWDLSFVWERFRTLLQPVSLLSGCYSSQ